VFADYFTGQQQLILVSYAVLRNPLSSSDLQMRRTEYDALISNASMTPAQVQGAVYLKFTIINNVVTILPNRVVYVARDAAGAIVLL
jgi:hypothetical protein